MNKKDPYLMVYENHRLAQWVGDWMSGPQAAQWIKLRSNEKRISRESESRDPISLETVWEDGDLKPAKLYKLGLIGVYDSLELIYSSESINAQDFCAGVVSMQDLLFDIDW